MYTYTMHNVHALLGRIPAHAAATEAIHTTASLKTYYMMERGEDKQAGRAIGAERKPITVAAWAYR